MKRYCSSCGRELVWFERGTCLSCKRKKHVEDTVRHRRRLLEEKGIRRGVWDTPHGTFHYEESLPEVIDAESLSKEERKKLDEEMAKIKKDLSTVSKKKTWKAREKLQSEVLSEINRKHTLGELQCSFCRSTHVNYHVTIIGDTPENEVELTISCNDCGYRKTELIKKQKKR